MGRYWYLVVLLRHRAVGDQSQVEIHSKMWMQPSLHSSLEHLLCRRAWEPFQHGTLQVSLRQDQCRQTEDLSSLGHHQIHPLGSPRWPHRDVWCQLNLTARGHGYQHSRCPHKPAAPAVRPRQRCRGGMPSHPKTLMEGWGTASPPCGT